MTYSPRGAHAQSKLANLLFTLELQRRLTATGSPVRALAAHPGYQFKEIQNPKKLVKKIFDNMKQMETSGADFNTFVVDTKGTLADHLALRTEQRLTQIYGKSNIQFVIRVEDGILTIPPGGTFMPEGTL
ncbi:hypothetical protein [Streptomyces cellulosae]|uniref:Short-chain dehydrogenase n=1 Tax=Streptomyces cellulosae TaxID=1968 RepID=A0ABW7Y1Y9_STRCE